MTRTSILSVIAAVAMVPAVAAQSPAPLPEGVIVTTRAFINGKEVKPEEAQKMMQGIVVRALAPEAPRTGAEATPAPEPPKPAPGPEAAKPCCPTPDCTCGPAPKPCECRPGATCGPKTPPAPVAAPPAPAPQPAAAPACDKPTPAVPTVRVVSAKQITGKAPVCPNCGKVRTKTRTGVVRPAPGDMPPCGKARPFDKPEMSTMPPCAKRHGHIVRPAIQVRRVERSAAPAAESPKAVKVIINGVEAIVPVVPEGVNITIKPL